MDATAIIIDKPGTLSLRDVALVDPTPGDAVVEVLWSGISTGTERLLWEGRMPSFPGMGYPLVPGYETVGRVLRSGEAGRVRHGDLVFVPGARCYAGVNALFGGAASLLVTDSSRLVAVPETLGADATLMALAATAFRAVACHDATLPGVVIGHGVLGRLIARMAIALGGEPPVVWESNPARRGGAVGYDVIDRPDTAAPGAPRHDTIIDASGDPAVMDLAVPHLARRGALVLAGFYGRPLSLAFPPAFMREARFLISAEFTADDLAATAALVEAGRLDLSGLVTHHATVADAESAYRTAFDDPACLKMALEWRRSA